MDINSETFKRFFFQNKRMVEKKKMLRFLLLLEPWCLEKCNDDAKTASYLSVFLVFMCAFLSFFDFFSLG